MKYKQLLKHLQNMSDKELEKDVLLRDYGNQETHVAEDFFSNQIGFNDLEKD
jgi:hypothetical protein